MLMSSTMRRALNAFLCVVALVCAENLYFYYQRHWSFASCILCTDSTHRSQTAFAHEHCSDHEAAGRVTLGTLIVAFIEVNTRVMMTV